jgi:hypothetical protein
MGMKFSLATYVSAQKPNPKINRFLEVYKGLSKEEKSVIDDLVDDLCAKCPAMGAYSAFELIGVLGEFLAKHEVKR